MKRIFDRLNEMPLNMLICVARKFKLDIRIDEERLSIMKRLEEVISDYLVDHEHCDDSCVEGVLSKYNLLDNIEVPHERYIKPEHIFNKIQNFVTYVDMILIDDNWCYVYWDLSYNDYNKIKKSPDFKGMELHFLYKADGFDNQYMVYDEREIIPISIEDIDRNFYQQYHYTYCCCLLIAKYTTGKHLLSASGEVFFPHASPLQQRNNLSEDEYQILKLSQNLSLYPPSKHTTLESTIPQDTIYDMRHEPIQQEGRG